MEYAIKIRNVTKSFNEKTVLSNVDMTVKRKEIYALLGVNGAGKTTLMKLLFGILKKDSGSISLLGKQIDCDGMNPIFSCIGNIIETPVFYKNLTAADNLYIHCEYIGKQYQKDIPEMLALVGLCGKDNKRVNDFSLGMKQRLALARALIGKPQLLVLDEPINGLDPMGISDTRDLLMQINQELGTAMLISSHIISEIEKIADTVGILDNGVMLEEKPLKQILLGCHDLEEHFKKVVMGGRQNV